MTETFDSMKLKEEIPLKHQIFFNYNSELYAQDCFLLIKEPLRY